MKIIVAFKEEDFWRSEYAVAEDCPITRALRRTAWAGLEDVGTTLSTPADEEGNRVHSIPVEKIRGYEEMTRYVIRRSFFRENLPLTDFDLQVNDNLIYPLLESLIETAVV